jgi:pimeloyl-ACP methyl ester carboxylesterase
MGPKGTSTRLRFPPVDACASSNASHLLACLCIGETVNCHRVACSLKRAAALRQPLCDRLHRLRCPVTILYGEYDALPHAAADDLLPRLAVQASVSRAGLCSYRHRHRHRHRH